jgi:hypothetical protein
MSSNELINDFKDNTRIPVACNNTVKDLRNGKYIAVFEKYMEII